MIYSLNDIYEIIKHGENKYVLEPSAVAYLSKIEKDISVISAAMKKQFATVSSSSSVSTTSGSSSNSMPRTYPAHSFKHGSRTGKSSGKDSSSFGKDSSSFGKDSSSFGKDNNDLAWENVRSFKTTKIEKKEGIEKKINEIRICLNKISNKNYDSQRDTIFALILEIAEDLSNETDIQRVAQSIFDIASTNKFYSEMYAKIYKELMDIYSVFGSILSLFLSQYLESLTNLKYADPNEDYDLFCEYNKQNDKRKATALFIVHMMKQGVIQWESVLNIITHLLQKIEIFIDTPNSVNEIEELTELVNIMITEGYSALIKLADSEGSNQIVEYVSKINAFSKYKVKEKVSLSSRIVFKYMDMVTFIEKQNKITNA